VTKPFDCKTSHKTYWIFPASGTFTQEFSPGARILSIRFDLALRGGAPLFVRPTHQRCEASAFQYLEQSARKLIQELNSWSDVETLQVSRAEIPLEDHLRIDAAFRIWLADYVNVMQKLLPLPLFHLVQTPGGNITEGMEKARIPKLI
jgi:hypothetical protein